MGGVGSGGGAVFAVDTASNTVGASWGTPGLPLGLTVTPDQGPVAAFNATPAVAGQATRLDGSASTSPGAPIATYSWTFGDGTHAITETPTTTHIYSTAGTYNITLTVTDSDGTSTQQVFTGQTVSLEGLPTAKITHRVTISP